MTVDQLIAALQALPVEHRALPAVTNRDFFVELDSAPAVRAIGYFDAQHGARVLGEVVIIE